MSECSFNRLLQLLDKQLDLDEQLEVYGHLERCDICHEAVRQLLRERDGSLSIYRAYREKPPVVRRLINAAGSGPGLSFNHPTPGRDRRADF